MRNLVRLIVIVALLLPGVARAQEPAPFVLTAEMGRGAVQRAEWQPNGSLILVDTVRGAWLYTPSLADAGFLPDARLARFSPDGSRLAGVDPDNRITFWDASTLAKTSTLPGHAAYVRALEWSPDGRHLASLDPTGAIRVWDVAAGGEPLGLALEGADTLAWSKAGSYLAALDEATGHLQVWTIEGAPVTSWGRPERVSDYGYEMLWRDDSQLMWIEDNEIPKGELWDSVTHTITRLDLGYANAFSPDGTKLAINSHVIEIDGGEGFTVNTGRVNHISWSPDGHAVAFGTWIATLGGYTYVTIADGTTGERLRSVQNVHAIEQLYWSPDSTRLLVVDSASQIEVVNLEDSTIPRRFGEHTRIGATAVWRSDGQIIATADTLYGANLWEAATGEQIGSRLGQGQPASWLAWQPGGTLLATAGGNGWQSLNNNVTIWQSDPDIPTSDSPRLITLPHIGLVADLAWSPDGTTLARAEQSQYIRLWRPEAPNLTQIIDLWAILSRDLSSGQRIGSIGWSSTSANLDYAFASSGNGGGVRAFNVAEETILPTIGGMNYASTWTWTPDDRFLWANWDSHGSGGTNEPVPVPRDIHLRNEGLTGDDPPALTLIGLPERVKEAVFSPDGSLIMGFDVAGHGVIWDTATQAVVISLDGVDDAAWAPDGSLLVVYGADGVIRLLDPATGEIVQALTRHFHDTRGRISGNPQVIWGADSQRFAVLDGGALFVYTRGI